MVTKNLASSSFFSPTSSCCWRRVPSNQSQLPVEQLLSDGNGDAKNECGSWNVKALVRKFNLLNNSSGSQRRHHPQPDYVMRLETILFAKFGHQWRTHWRTSGPRDRTPGLPGSDNKHILQNPPFKKVKIAHPTSYLKWCENVLLVKGGKRLNGVRNWTLHSRAGFIGV